MRSLLLGCVLNFILIFQIQANNLSLFTCDFDKIEKELYPLSLLEDKILNQDEYPQSLATNKGIENTLFFNLQNSENTFEAGPFFLGCCLGVPGVAIIYLTQEDDRDAIRSSVQGFLLGKLIIIGLYIYYVFILSQISTSTF